MWSINERAAAPWSVSFRLFGKTFSFTLSKGKAGIDVPAYSSEWMDDLLEFLLQRAEALKSV